jgi:CheY-like chemotaxis protein
MNENLNKFKYNFVMLVDDDDITNFLNRKLIEVCSFSKKIQGHNKPLEALAFLKQTVESNEPYPEVFFIDLNMPVMNGFELLEQMKQLSENKFNGSKVVVLTSSVDPNDKKRVGLISENISILNKPLTEKMLAAL